MDSNTATVHQKRGAAPGERLPRTRHSGLSPEAMAEIKALSTNFPDKLAATIPALYAAQADLGFLSLEAMREVANLLDVPESHVYGVATFYTMLKKHPVGRFHFQVCTNLCCMLRGAQGLFNRLCETLKVHPGEVTPDGLWSLEEVECLGSCGSGPCLQVNSRIYDEFLEEETLGAILEACRRGEVMAWGAEEKSAWGKA